MRNKESVSSQETQEWGERFGKTLPANSIVALFGELGAGKTTFIKGLVRGAAGIDPKDVSSPTFTYLHQYLGSKTVYHFDLYRLKSAEEFLSMGFDEYFSLGGICCLEWPERILPFLPKETMQIFIEHKEEGKRNICFEEKK